MSLFVLGCQISDDDRCARGWVWDESVRACRAVDTDTSPVGDTGTGTASEPGDDAGDGSVDGSPDTGGTEAETETGPTFGTPCFADTECTGAVSFCQLDIRKPGEPGICTIRDCVASDCPDGFQCCDCSHLGQSISCLPDEGAEEAASFTCVCS